MKTNFDYELIVIGGGSGGHAAAHKAVSLGLKTALIENAEELGGLCILKGCMPTKALIETANRMRIIRDAARFGIKAAPPELNLEVFRKRIHDLLEDFKNARVSEMENGDYRLVRAKACFISDHELELTDQSGAVSHLTAETFIIATGSTVDIPDIPGLKGTPYWTSDDLRGFPFLPKRIAIMGAGAIALESAHLFEGLGSEVVIIARGEQMLSGHDADLSAGMEAETKERGIRFFNNSTVENVGYDAGEFFLTFGKRNEKLRVDALLIAIGRTPRTKGLGLEAIGVAKEDGRILTDERSATSRSHIFAAGDCSSSHAVVHMAVLQGEVAAKNAHRFLYEDHSTTAAEWNRDSIMNAWFTEPQAVMIGLSEKEALEKGIPIQIGKADYQDHGKGMIAGSRHGFLKIIASATDGRLLGAVGLGPEVAETGHLLQHAIEQGLTVAEYLTLPNYHPTFAEAWSRAVEDIYEAQRFK